MNSIELRDFFTDIKYSWEKDRENLEVICKLTKTRVRPEIGEFKFTFGLEQPFLIKAISDHIKAKSFFEIGTGRGTACYSVALGPSVKEIKTVDITPFQQKMDTAINYRSACVSNADLYEMIPFEEKEKIMFMHTSQVEDAIANRDNSFDLCFIDGNHSDPRIIYGDFKVCQKIVKNGGVILFDDYHPTKFAVREVVHKILEENPRYDATLVKFHGHLFDERNKAPDNGVVIMYV